MSETGSFGQETTPEILHPQAMNMTARTSESSLAVTDDLNHNDVTTAAVMVSTSGEYLTASNAYMSGQLETYILYYTNTALTSVGLVANTMAWITLVNKKEGLNKVIVLLFQHQSVIDVIVCLISLSLSIVPRTWYTGIKMLDTFLCYIWRSQMLYWWFFYVSMGNLMLLAVERYVAVCYPFKHNDISRAHVKVALAIIYVCVSIIVTLQHIDDFDVIGACDFRSVLPDSIIFYYSRSIGLLSWIVNCVAPCILLSIVYTRIILTLKRRQPDRLGNSRVISNATNGLTKTAIITTLIQLIASGYASTLYLINRFGVDIYNGADSTLQLGVLIATINSSANPFIYIMLMPVYKRNFLSTFCKCKILHDQGGVQECTTSGTRQTESEPSGSGVEMRDRITDQSVHESHLKY